MKRFTRIVRVDETGSTNEDVAAILGEPQARGMVLVARHQRSGSGRRGRVWIAPAGTSLLCTIALPEPLPSNSLWAVPFWTALIARDAVEQLGTPALVQWPNDVLAPEGKVAGILCISRVNGSSAWAGCGIGINVIRPRDETPFAPLDAPPAFLSDRAEVAIDDALDALLFQAEAQYDLLHEPQTIAGEWQRAARLPRTYRILKDGKAQPFEATALELSNDGSLIVERSGRRETVTLADARVLR